MNLSIYILLEALLFVFFMVKSLTTGRNDRLYWLSALLMFAIMVLRSYDGSLCNWQDDMPEYVKFYMGDASSIYGIALEKNSDIEPGLGIICHLLWLFPRHPLIFVFFTRLICMAPIFYAIYRYSEHREASLILLMTMPGLWLVEMITLRQAIAMSLVLTSIILAIEKPRYWYLWALPPLVLGLFTHSTTILLVVMLAAVYVVPFNRWVSYAMLGVSALLAGVFADILAGAFASVMGPLEAMSRVTGYITNQTYDNDVVNFLYFVVMALFGCATAYFCDTEDKRSVFFVKCLVAGIFVYNMLGRFPLVNRMTAIFFLLGVLGALPKLPKTDVKLTESVSWWCLVVILLFFMWRSMYELAGVDSVFLPYHFIFERPMLWMYQ